MSVQDVLIFGRDGSSAGSVAAAFEATGCLPGGDDGGPAARVPDPFRVGDDDVSMRGRPFTPEEEAFSGPDRPESGSDPEPEPLPPLSGRYNRSRLRSRRFRSTSKYLNLGPEPWH